MVSTRIVFLIFMACLPSVLGFACGTGGLDSYVAKTSIMNHCDSRLSQFNSCCVDHDKCYDRQLGRSNCDKIFCKCLDKAATGTFLCKWDAKKFCWVVKLFGGKAYNKAAR
ncbi:hypothetical protein FO519_001701 [Halicephalobus sp. NKZ332]|nr:hypothetical protein FO519_001701 [Halicephalobus sp. NKZ332]